MPAAKTEIPVRALATVRGQFGDGPAGRRRTIPRAVAGEVERLTGARSRRCEIDRCENDALIAESAVRIRDRAHRHTEGAKNAEQAGSGIGRHAAREQPGIVGVEQGAQVIAATSQLIRKIVERFVHHDRASQQSAERSVVEFLPQRTGGGVGELQLRRVEVETQCPRRKVGAAHGAQRELASAEATTRDVIRCRHERTLHTRIARQVGATEILPVQRAVVLIRSEAEHREARRIAVGTGHQRHAWQRCCQGGEIACLTGRHVAVVDGALAAADVRRAIVTCGSRAIADDTHFVELLHRP